MAECTTCHASIDWAITPAGKRMPVDHDSAGQPDGNLAVRRDDDGTLTARVLRKDEAPAEGEIRGTSHWSTCPDSKLHKRGTRSLLLR